MPTFSPSSPRIAIVGAGLAGLVAAHRLTAAGLGVQVFDKGRGVGGRLSTRREGERQFDHGAQYFTVESAEFRAAVDDWLAQGVAAEWTGRIAATDAPGQFTSSAPKTRYVGVPTMSAIAKHLAARINVSSSVRIAALDRHAGQWRLTDDAGQTHDGFIAVLVALPAPQAADLLVASPALANACRTVTMRPCWAVMAALTAPLAAPFDGLFVNQGPLSWIARDNSKPGRPPAEAWVLHASREWSEANLEFPAEVVADELVAAWREVVGVTLAVENVTAHRWRYSGPAEPLAERCLADADRGLFAAGDWCGGPRVEGAYLSGSAAAERIIQSIG